MARTTTKSQAAPVKVVGNELPTFTFESFNLTPNDLPRSAMVPARELCQLVDHVMDVATGAATVFELISTHEQEIDNSNIAYLSPSNLGRLRRLATRSLESLDDNASSIATRLHKLARGEA